MRRESNPAQWGWGCPTGSDVQAARAKVADFIGAASIEELVLVENAMGGINALMRSWPDLGQRQGPPPAQLQTRFNALAGVDGVNVILLLSIGYDGFYNVYSWLQETLGLELLIVPLAFPLNSKEDVLRPVREALRVNGSRVSVAVFSHIASMPVVINPVEELVALCHNHTTGRIPVIIDGAHVPGQIPLNVSRIGADAYIGDLVGYTFASVRLAGCRSAAICPAVAAFPFICMTDVRCVDLGMCCSTSGCSHRRDQHSSMSLKTQPASRACYCTSIYNPPPPAPISRRMERLPVVSTTSVRFGAWFWFAGCSCFACSPDRVKSTSMWLAFLCCALSLCCRYKGLHCLLRS